VTFEWLRRAGAGRIYLSAAVELVGWQSRGRRWTKTSAGQHFSVVSTVRMKAETRPVGGGLRAPGMVAALSFGWVVLVSWLQLARIAGAKPPWNNLGAGDSLVFVTDAYHHGLAGNPSAVGSAGPVVWRRRLIRANESMRRSPRTPVVDREEAVQQG
jgi:hypothetical protein